LIKSLLFIQILLNLSIGPALTGLAIFSGCTPSDPVKGHYMSLTAFGTNAFDLHFGIVAFIIESTLI
jgi:hypothetical protein